MKLYDYVLSGNCYKIRLFLGFLGLDYDKEAVDFYPGRAHKSDSFLGINPLGQLPVLEDGDTRIRDAQAILVYLATRYDETGVWWPMNQPRQLAEAAQWLAFADMITGSASAARLHDTLLFSHIDVEACRAEAHRLFRVLDEHLFFAEQKAQAWLCPGDHPTIADIACFPYVVLSEDGGISRIDYPAIRRWLERFKRIPGFTVMSGVFPSDV